MSEVTLEALHKAVHQLNLCHEKLATKVSSVEHDILEYFGGLIAVLQEKQNELLEKLHGINRDTAEILNKQKELLEGNIFAIENEGRDPPPLSTCPLDPMIHSIELLRYCSGFANMDKEKLSRETGYLHNLEYGRPYFADLESENPSCFIEAQTLSGTLIFKIRDMAKRLCGQLRDDLISYKLEGPEGVHFDAISSAGIVNSKLQVSMVSTQKMPQFSSIKLRLLYDGVELIQGTERIFPWSDTDGKWIYEGRIPIPISCAFAYGSEIFITSRDTVQVLDLMGTVKRGWGKSGKELCEFSSPIGITVYGDQVFVADSKNNRIQTFDLNGNYERQVPCSNPKSIAFHDNLLWVSSNKKILALDNNNQFVHDICCSDEVTSFSFTKNSEIVVLFERNPMVHSSRPRSAVIDFDGYQVVLEGNIAQRFKSIWAYGDYVFGSPLHDSKLFCFNRFSPRSPLVMSKQRFLRGSPFSWSMLPHGKLIVVGVGFGTANFCIIDCGFDEPIDSNRLFLFKYFHEQATQRNMDVKNIFEMVVSMCFKA
jgi:hypothetical protein